MARKKILTVVGTRPNFIKVTQFRKEFEKFPDLFEFKLVHTGQHYDAGMSEIFFQQLELQQPDFYLGVGQGPPGEQTGHILAQLTKVIELWKPDLVIVVGDVNSTLAGALAANKMGVKLAHLEAGLRSGDRQMPEEINRILTDEISDLLFVTEKAGDENLRKAGKSSSQIHFVGNTMIDALVAFDSAIVASPALEEIGLEPKKFALMTMHRPANVDDADQLKLLLDLISAIAVHYTVVFPIHPRTRNRIHSFGLDEAFSAEKKLILIDPLDYLGFQKLVRECAFVITDSGGIQEETTFRQVPCLTLRPSTERPSTVELGTNELVPFDVELIRQKIAEIAGGTFKKGVIPPLWDGKSTERMVKVLAEIL